MNKKTKRGIILTSLASIAFAGSLLAGSTYALFTSESKTDIVVSSGKVDVKATISDLTVYSPTSISTSNGNEIDNDADASDHGTNTFKNGGTASLVDNKLTLINVAPGDKVTFNINITNYSNIIAKYRTFVACEDDTGLFAGLKCTIGNEISFSGLTNVSNWANLEATSNTEGTSVSILPCTVELPTNAGDEYQSKKCTITYTVEAVQGNTATTDKADGTYELYTVSDLKWFQKNCNTISGTTVTLMKDIDLNGANWAPINWNCQHKTMGTFDGNSHKIFDFEVSKNEGQKTNGTDINKDLGLFGQTVNVTIKNLEISEAKISGHGRVGAILGQGQASSIKNCTVTNSTIAAYPWSNTLGNLDDGDKAGAVVGQLNESSKSLSECYVERCTISGYRDLGGVAGSVNSGCNISSNNVNNASNATGSTTIKYNSSWANYDDKHAGDNVDYIVGSKNSATIDGTNKYFSTTIENDNNLQSL